MFRFFKKHQEKVNYLLVGGWNTVFGYLVFAASYYLFGKHIHYMFLLIASSVISITNAYIGYKIFVFKTTGNFVREYMRFYVVYGASILVNLILLPIIVEVTGLSPVIAQGFVIVLTVIASYFGHRNFSFS